MMPDTLDRERSTASRLLDVRLVATRWLAEDIIQYEFAAPDGSLLPPHEAGAHVDVHIAPDLMRSYSLVGDGHDRSRYVIAVQTEADGRGGSRQLAETFRVGRRVTISAPRNAFPLEASAGEVVLIGGGIGITPLIGMAEHRARLGRPWHLHYGTRNPARTPFRDWLATNAAHVSLTHSDGPDGRFPDLAAILASGGPDTHFYCCGPGAMIDRFLEAARHLPPERVHIERFGAAPVSAELAGLMVELPSAGLSVEVKPGQSILHALLEAGAMIPFACEHGICGACEMRVLEGEPDHKDGLLTPEEQAAGDTMFVCCSGARSKRLVLDFKD